MCTICLYDKDEVRHMISLWDLKEHRKNKNCWWEKLGHTRKSTRKETLTRNFSLQYYRQSSAKPAQSLSSKIFKLPNLIAYTALVPTVHRLMFRHRSVTKTFKQTSAEIKIKNISWVQNRLRELGSSGWSASLEKQNQTWARLRHQRQSLATVWFWRQDKASHRHLVKHSVACDFLSLIMITFIFNVFFCLCFSRYFSPLLPPRLQLLIKQFNIVWIEE